jgi:hypothetical protein
MLLLDKIKKKEDFKGKIFLEKNTKKSWKKARKEQKSLNIVRFKENNFMGKRQFYLFGEGTV